MAINKVCCIIDFDGFSFRSYIDRSTFASEFLIREIGFIRIDPEFGEFLAESYSFDLSFYDFSHCPDATQTINHQIRYITGLPFKPQPGEKVHDYSKVQACIKTIYDRCRTPERDVVAFKGGDKEKMYLDELGIPNLDLAMYGCPKYEQLVKRNLVQSHLIDCGFHRKIDDEAGVIHCPRAEVTAFKDWLLLNYPPGSMLEKECLKFFDRKSTAEFKSPFKYQFQDRGFIGSLTVPKVYSCTFRAHGTGDIYVIVQEPTAQKPMLSSTRKKPLFYGRVEVGESNDPCLPEVKWCLSQKLIPPVVDSQVYHYVCPTNKDMKTCRTGRRKTQ